MVVVVKVWGFLSSSSSDDGEDDNDDCDGNDGGNGGGGDDDNNGGNNSANGGSYSLEGHMQLLSLTSGQDYCVRYVHDYRPQLERSTSTNINLSTYYRDYDDDFVPHRNSMWKWLYEHVFMNVVYAIYYIMHVFWYVSIDDACIYTFTLYLVC